MQHLLLGNTTQTANGVTTRPGPSLDLNFAASLNTVDQVSGKNLVSFTRTTSGTYFDSAGVLRSAAVNLLLRSEEFNALPWATQSTPPTITANTAVSPNGSLTADTITFASADSRLQSDTISFTAGVAYTFSIYARAVGTSLNKFRLAFFDGAQQNSADFTVSNLTWTRITATFIAANTALGRVQIRNATDVLANSLFFWGAQLETGSVATAYIPTTSTVNSAPRFDHNPITLESLGLLVEELRTNSVTNNTMVGAVAGTPGTLPTSWGNFTSPAGLTRTIVGSGTVNGINYIDVRFNGTPSSTGEITLYLSPATTATLAQAWITTAWLSLAGGSTSNIATISFRNFELNSGLYVRETGVNFVSSISSDLVRRQNVTTSFGSGANQIQFVLTIYPAASGTPIDITLRIGLPQLEQGAFASSVIPTTTTTFTRNPDIAAISGSNFGVTRTNLLSRSEEFDNSGVWGVLNVTVSGNTQVAPNGTTSADTITDVNGVTSANVGCFQSTTLADSTTYAMSCYVKAGTKTTCRVGIRDKNGTNIFANFNLATGSTTVGNAISSTIQDAGNGWYRCTAICASLTGATSPRGLVYIDTASYTANGTGTIHVWGAQLETGSAATAYIPTTTTAASVLDSWYRQSEGTLFSAFSIPTSSTTGGARVYSISNSAATTQAWLRLQGGTNRVYEVTDSSTQQAVLSAGTFSAGVLYRGAVALKTNDFGFSENGSTPTVDNSGTLGTVDRMGIGMDASGTAPLNGHIRRLTYYPIRIPNSLLQAITL